MSRERELLERVLFQFGKWHMQAEYDWDSEYDLKKEIEDFLSTPEPTQDDEPVAWASGVRDLLSWDKLYDDMSPLYFHSKQKTQNEKRMDAILALCGKSAPRPDFVRLSEEEVDVIEASIPPKMGLNVAKKLFADRIQDALMEKNSINRSEPDSIDLQSRCRGDKL